MRKSFRVLFTIWMTAALGACAQSRQTPRPLGAQPVAAPKEVEETAEPSPSQVSLEWGAAEKIAIPKSQALSAHGSEKVLDLFFSNHYLQVDLRDFLQATYRPSETLTFRDRQVALASLALTALLDANALDRGKYEGAPRYRTMHAAFVLLTPYQTSKRDTPETLYQRLLEDWREQCRKENLAPDECAFTIILRKEEWLTALPDFYRPVGETGEDMAKQIFDTYEFYRGFEPVTYAGSLNDQIKQAHDAGEIVLSGYLDSLADGIVNYAAQAIPAEPQAILSGALREFVDRHVSPRAAPAHHQYWRSRLSDLAQEVEVALENPVSVRIRDFVEPAFRRYAVEMHFVREAVTESFIRRAQAVWLRRKYTWVADEKGFDLRTPYGESVAEVLNPGWMRSHPDIRNPKGRLYFQKPTGPSYGSPQAGTFYRNPWGDVSFTARDVPSDYHRFFELIQDRLDAEYLAMKRRETLAGFQTGAVNGMEDFAPEGYRNRVLEESFLHRRAGRFGILRVAKGQNVAAEFVKMASRISPLNPAESETEFKGTVERLRLADLSSLREYSDQYSPLLSRARRENPLEEVMHELLFRREYRDIREEKWIGKPRDAFVDRETGDTLYVVLLDEKLIEKKPVSGRDPSLDQQALMAKAADRYAQDALQRVLFRQLKNLDMQIARPELVFGSPEFSGNAPSAEALMSAVKEHVARLAEAEGEQKAWAGYLNHLAALGIRPRHYSGPEWGVFQATPSRPIGGVSRR